ncbi:MAG TPA: hypothetical protein VN734_06245 [Acidobacteriaceae bacterium]|nr:hypothetical protein [Acidobacteriaceae bacterium]
MNRREFLAALTASAAISSLPCSAQSTQSSPSLAIGAVQPHSTIPDEFIGLSYESAQLANSEFFSAKNHALIHIFRELAPHGNLRLGGGSSEYTTYSDEAPSGLPPFEVFGPDTSKTVKQGTITSSLALRKLREFLDATNWSCLYGLNLGQGTIENAVREATAAHKILGSRLLAFQIGNEPDSFRRRFRPQTYGPEDFLADWNRFHTAILAAVPQAKFAGPDISNKLPYLTAFAQEAPRHPDVILLTSHYYAMGPSSSPAATLQNLLSPDPKLATLKRRDLHVIAEAQQSAHLPYRMSEGNSCWDGGKPGVSDTFASALWCAGYMLQCATRGWTGVNLHGGGNGYYTPIAGAPSTGFTRRPEFFGMRFAQHFVGAQLATATLNNAGPLVDAFVFERFGDLELALINKTDTACTCVLPLGVLASPALLLSGPAIDAKEGVHLSPVRNRRYGEVAIAAPYTATAFKLKRRNTMVQKTEE